MFTFFVKTLQISQGFSGELIDIKIITVGKKIDWNWIIYTCDTMIHNFFQVCPGGADTAKIYIIAIRAYSHIQEGCMYRVKSCFEKKFKLLEEELKVKCEDCDRHSSVIESFNDATNFGDSRNLLPESFMINIFQNKSTFSVLIFL